MPDKSLRVVYLHDQKHCWRQTIIFFLPVVVIQKDLILAERNQNMSTVNEHTVQHYWKSHMLSGIVRVTLNSNWKLSLC